MNRSKLLLLLAFIAMPIGVVAQTADEEVSQGLQLEKLMHEGEALNKYRLALKIQPDNLVALTRASLMCSRIGNRETDKDKQTVYFKVAKIYADGALKINPENAEANLVEAVAMGRMALISGAKQKVAALRGIKRYTELAIKYDPANPDAWFLLGKWNYEVYNLNFFERAAANMLFGGVPKSSLKDAITYYQKSLQLDPGFIQAYYELGKAYHKNNEDAQAISTLKKALSLRNTHEDDSTFKAGANQLLESLQ
ncbi:MAG TPA: tetratricopeptide repeat protein [Chitinophagaceae bacterium]|nr:tetratricopeptide repeat protein [Chitinophagaceae bacterium]